MMAECPSSSRKSAEAHTSFHLFARLPTEIRLEIWKASLPNRVVSIDSRKPCPGPTSDRIQLWQRPPSIAHVCQESRAIALKCGHLRWAEDINGPGNTVAKTWIDPIRDLVYIDTVTRLLDCFKGGIPSDHILADAKQAKAVVMSWQYLSFHSIEDTARVLELLLNPFVFIAYKFIVHMSKQEAIESGLFGADAEEALVLVEYTDEVRLRKFAAACSDTEGDTYFLDEHLKSFGNSDPNFVSPYEQTKADFTRWWIELRRHGIPKHHVAKKDAKYEGLYDQFGFLNINHSLVQKAKESMPKYRPVFIFELCQNSLHLIIMRHIPDKSTFRRVWNDLFARRINTADDLRTYFSNNTLQ